jgi:PPM family protein phosphatase
MPIRPGIEFANLTDIGCQREDNEDSSAYWEPENEEQFQQKGRLAVIADGMGGYEGGQQASSLAVKTVCEAYEEAPAGDPQSDLLLGLHLAHARIQEYARQHPGFFGMGTTCTAVSLRKQELYFAHVGDSRLYLVRDGKISRLTRDHSYVGRLVESGLLAPEQAETHPQRNVLTAALGVGSELTPQFPPQPILLQDQDVLVLCTDGLWGQVSDEELRQATSSRNPEEACRKLIELARARGGPDNITVQVMRLSANGAGKREAEAV